jgi:hypothetical protein
VQRELLEVASRFRDNVTEEAHNDASSLCTSHGDVKEDLVGNLKQAVKMEVDRRRESSEMHGFH